MLGLTIRVCDGKSGNERRGRLSGERDAMLRKLQMRKRKAKTLRIRVAVSLLLCFLLCFNLFISLPAEAYSLLGEEILTEPVAAGVNLQRFLHQTPEGPLKIYVLRIDLTNPYVRVDALIGSDDRSFDSASTVLDKARRAGAVAAINGDFFITKEGKHPLGFNVKGGRLVTSPMFRDDFYTFVLTKSLVPSVGLFQFQGTVSVIPPGSDKPLSYPLSGINKPPYSMVKNGAVCDSDADALQLYNAYWGSTSRGAQPGWSGWTEVVVKDGVVQEIRIDQPPVAIPPDGYVLSGQGAAAQFLQQWCVPGARVYVEYKVTPDVGEIQTAVGGKDLLVANGKPTGVYSKELEGKFARSAVGFTRDGKTLYLVAVEKSSESRGMYLGELAEFLANRLGVWCALNLDGGGSTSIAARPLGEEQAVLLNTPSQESQRPVPVALGVFSTAPKGSLSGLVIRGPQELLAGLSGSYTVRAYDQYYNPVPVDPAKVVWSVKNVRGTVENGIFRPQEGGTAVLVASYQGVKKEFPVRVIGASDLAALEVTPGEIRLDPGAEIALIVEARGKDGRVWQLPADAVQWEATGGVGTVANGVFRATTSDAAGSLKARFLSLTAEVPVTVGVPLPPDVRNHWSSVPVRELMRLGVLKGYPDGSYRPDQPVTRAEIVTILAKAFGWDAAGDVRLPFKDRIPDWALPGLKAAWSRGVIKGYEDGTFRPDKPVTRSELTVMMSLALGLSCPSAQQQVAFKDGAIIPVWARDAVERLAAAGIVKGSDGYFRPLATATRAEVAALVYQALTFSK
ncbi:MAG: S-layer homology domain-containing protein [Thermacetogeniaceae bacterium]